MLQISNLTGLRGDRLLFKNLSFSVEEGELLLIKGQNGSGKTSLLRLVCGLGTPEAGDVLWNGEPITAIRPEFFRSLVFIGHDNGVNLDLTVEENLTFHRHLKQSPSNRSTKEILEQLDVVRYLKVPCRFLSAGQRRRIALARLALSQAKLWLLDEPFNSLDERVLNIVIELVIDHLNRGGLCLTTSHQMVDWRGASVKEIQLGKSA